MYIDVDDMMHLASGQGKMLRVDEIILPQKAYKGGALSLWKIEILEKKYPNNVPKCSMQFVSKYKTDFIILLLILKTVILEEREKSFQVSTVIMEATTSFWSKWAVSKIISLWSSLWSA